jgi:hypothetical protein
LQNKKTSFLFYPHHVLKTLLNDNSGGGGAELLTEQLPNTSLLSLYMEL